MSPVDESGSRNVAERPLWAVGLMFAVHLAWLAFCALWIPATFGDAISRRFGSPLFVLPAIIFAYTFAPLLASLSQFGRDYWSLVGKGGTPLQATVKLLIFGGLFVVLGVGMHWYAARY